MNWTREFQEAFRSSPELFAYLGWKGPEQVDTTYSLFVPRRLASRIKEQGPHGVLARQFLPQTDELNQGGLYDPIGDQAFNRAPQLIHRYRTRALFTPTTVCPVHCRYCFRKNELNATEELFAGDFEETLSYLRMHPEISEIIFTGGDPLTLSNEKLARYLSAYAELPSIRDVRFHTRYPVIIPERIDQGLGTLIRDFAPRFRTLSLAIHINHRDEFDAEVVRAIQDLAGLPLQLLSQTVLLKGVNDDPSVLLALFDDLVRLRVRPYYLHHPDQVKGGLHFYVPLEVGRCIYAALRDELPGWALPHYVIDVPGGHGKVPAFNPETTSYSNVLLGRGGEAVQVVEPRSPE